MFIACKFVKLMPSNSKCNDECRMRIDVRVPRAINLLTGPELNNTVEAHGM